MPPADPSDEGGVAAPASGTSPKSDGGRARALVDSGRHSRVPTSLSDSERRERAAIILQTRYRGKRDRRNFQRMRKALVKLQARVRGSIVRKKGLQEQRTKMGAVNLYRSFVSNGSLDWRLESLQRKHRLISLIALGGLGAMILVMELIYADWQVRVTGADSDFDFEWYLFVLRWGTLISTVVLEVLVLDYHRFMFQSSKALTGSHKIPQDFVWGVVLDMMVCAFHPFVEVGGLLPSDEWRADGAASYAREAGMSFLGVEDVLALLAVLMFLRLPLVCLRHLWLHSKAMRMKARFLARSSHIDVSLLFALRVVMRDHAVAFLLIAGTISAFAFGYVYYIFERENAFLEGLNNPEGHDFTTSPEYFLNALWTICIIMVGLGFDSPPRSYMGRLVIFLNSVLGLALFALMTAAFADSLSLTDAELRIMHVVQRSDGSDRIQLAAVRVIQRAWKRKTNKALFQWLPKRVKRVIAPLGAPVGPISPDVRQRASRGGARFGAADIAAAATLADSPQSYTSAPSELLTPKTRERRNAAAAARDAVLKAAEARNAGMRHRQLARALNDWRVERHRNATTSEMIENVTLFLKEIKERVDEQHKGQESHARDLVRVLRRVDLLAQAVLPDGTELEPPPPQAQRRKGLKKGPPKKALKPPSDGRARSAPPGVAGGSGGGSVGGSVAGSATSSRPSSFRLQAPMQRSQTAAVRPPGAGTVSAGSRQLTVNVASGAGARYAPKSRIAESKVEPEVDADGDARAER